MPPAAPAAPPPPAPMLLVSQPGVTRDGTRLARQTYLDAQWTRFYQGLPRKMLGYVEQVRNAEGIVRMLNVFNSEGYCFVHAGSAEALQRYAIQLTTGVNTTLEDRTPASYTADDSNLWQTTSIWDSDSGTTNIFAVATPSLYDISVGVESQVYFGDITATAILADAVNIGTGAGDITTSGGIVGVGPYLFRYGYDGFIGWSVAGHPRNTTDTGSGSDNPVSDKIVTAVPIRGAGVPTAIFWSLSSLIIGTFVGTPKWFNFTTITTNGSILSANSVIEHNGIYYWATTSGFSQFSGVMQDVPNEYNQQWFLDNLNYAQRQKVFAFKVPRWKEIWWCFPYGDAEECTHAVIFNYEKKFWYDTVLPNDGRSAGQYNVTYSFPIMAGVTENSDTEGTSIWQHEVGLNEVSGPQNTPKAIPAWVETQEFSNLPQQPGAVGDNSARSYLRIEPDFNQAGPLYLEINTRANARAPITQPTGDGYPYLIPESDGTEGQAGYIEDPTEQTPTFSVMGRLASFVIKSNVVDGDFIWGAPMLHVTKGDGRVTG